MTIKENNFAGINVTNSIRVYFDINVDELTNDIIYDVQRTFDIENDENIETEYMNFSISSESYNKFINEINSMLSSDYPNVVVIECECSIDESYIYVLFESTDDNFIFDNKFVTFISNVLTNSYLYLDIDVVFDFSYPYNYDMIDDTYEETYGVTLEDIFEIQDIDYNTIYEK